MDYKKIVLCIVIIVILIFLYNWVFKDGGKKTLFRLKEANQKVEIKNDKIIPSSIFTYSFWVYVKEYTYKFSKKKHILAIVDDAKTNAYLEIYLDENVNDLQIKMATGNDWTNIETTTVERFPIQKWTHVLLSYRNRSMDVYIDGKIVNSKVISLPYRKQPTSSKIIINPPGDIVPTEDIVPTTPLTPPPSRQPLGEDGYSGFLATMQYFTRAVQPEEAYAIYKAGYSGGNWLSDLFDKYRLKIAFMEDSKEINSFVI